MLNANSVIESCENLAPLPPSASRLASTVSDGETDLREIVDIVKFDVALTARLLHASNSAMYGGIGEIASVDQAVIRLGYGFVLGIAVAAAVKPGLSSKIPQYGLDAGELWRRSVTTAVATEEVRLGSRGTVVPPECYTAGLLFDIGKLALARHLGDHELRMVSEARTIGALSELEAEVQLLGMNHAEVGAVVAQQWNLPRSVVHAIQHHHEPTRAMERLEGYEHPGEAQATNAICDAVHAGVRVMQTLTATPEEIAHIPIDPGTADRLKLEPAQMEWIACRTRDRIDSILEMYSTM